MNRMKHMDIHELIHTEIKAQITEQNKAYNLELRHNKRAYSFPLIYKFELETLRDNLLQITNSINQILKD